MINLSNYDQACFIKEFSNQFSINEIALIKGSNRILYLLKVKE